MVPFEKLQTFECNKNPHFFSKYVKFQSQHLQRLYLSGYGRKDFL